MTHRDQADDAGDKDDWGRRIWMIEFGGWGTRISGMEPIGEMGTVDG